MMRHWNNSADAAHGQASLPHVVWGATGGLSASVATGRQAAHGTRFAAFTLTEMLVALAVMVLAMAMVTTVFSVTTKTAATSAAISDVEAIIRNVADQLQQDLEYCDPSRSILAIHGRTQAAGLTEEDRQAGQYYRLMTGDPGLLTGADPRFTTTPPSQYSDPRADILMFFTQRPAASKAAALNPNWSDTFQDRLTRDARLSPIQVVYGHAAIDKAVPTGGGWAFADSLTHIEQPNPNVLSELPASRWPLVRRVAILDPDAPGGVRLDPTVGFGYSFGGEQELDRIARCYSLHTGYAADAAHLNLTDYLGLFAPGVNQWDGLLYNLAARSPYQVACAAGYASLPPPHPALQWSWNESRWVYNTLYVNGNETDHHIATVIEQPPAALADNLGVHLAPGCVWMQVELLLPEDPRNGLEHPLSDQRRDTPRWVEVQAEQTYVFVPDTVENRRLVESQVNATTGFPVSGSRLDTFARVVPRDIDLNPYTGSYGVDNIQVRMWPYAIRVTVRVIDQRGRLEEPIVRSIVHRFD